MRQADTDKNRHRSRVGTPQRRAKKGAYYEKKKSLGRGSFLLARGRAFYLRPRAKISHYTIFQDFCQVKNCTIFLMLDPRILCKK